MEDKNMIEGLKKLLEKRSEIKLSYAEDYKYLESLGWKEDWYQWTYRIKR